MFGVIQAQELKRGVFSCSHAPRGNFLSPLCGFCLATDDGGPDAEKCLFVVIADLHKKTINSRRDAKPRRYVLRFFSAPLRLCARNKF
jgi:hypothetical protein